MSRGFDGFEIDDFRGGDSRSGPDVDRGSSSSWARAGRQVLGIEPLGC